MAINRESLIAGFMVAALTMGAGAVPTSAADKNILVASNTGGGVVTQTSTTQETARPQITLHVGDDFNERRVAAILRGLARDNIPVEVAGGFERSECIGLRANGELVATLDERKASSTLHSVVRSVYDGHGVSKGLPTGPCAVHS